MQLCCTGATATHNMCNCYSYYGSYGKGSYYTAILSSIANALPLVVTNKEPILRGAALKALLERHKQSQDTRNRAAFVDRGANGISAGYTDAEFLHLQEVLLQGSDKNPLVS